MYYGAVGEATFGSVLIIMALVHIFAAGWYYLENDKMRRGSPER
jgi:hypothetical protein